MRQLSANVLSAGVDLPALGGGFSDGILQCLALLGGGIAVVEPGDGRGLSSGAAFLGPVGTAGDGVGDHPGGLTGRCLHGLLLHFPAVYRIESILNGQAHTGRGKPGKHGIFQFHPQVKTGNDGLEILFLLPQLPDVLQKLLLPGFLGQNSAGNSLGQGGMIQVLRIQTVLLGQLPQGRVQNFQNGLVSALFLHPGTDDLLELGIVFGVFQNLLPGESVLIFLVSGGLTFGTDGSFGKDCLLPREVVR